MKFLELTWSGANTFLRRGRSGGQVRDEYRDEYDPGRGGYGRAYAEEFGGDDQ